MNTDPNDFAFARPYTDISESQRGLTKREYFAAMALQGLMANPNNDNDFWSKDGEAAVKAADALIETLNESK